MAGTDPEIRHRLAQRLRTRRKQLGLRQVDAAKHVGVKPDTYIHWERAISFPEVHHLRQAQEAFDIELMDLAIDGAVGEDASTLSDALEPLEQEIARLRLQLEDEAGRLRSQFEDVRAGLRRLSGDE
ncbi:MAG: helix-turn-helix transcriptional regulator [Thermoleophilaceae bacterium]